MRGRFERASWEALPNWNADDPTDALAAFMRSCTVLGEKPDWSAVCAAGTRVPPKTRAEPIRRYFRDNFEPFRVINADETQTEAMVPPTGVGQLRHCTP